MKLSVCFEAFNFGEDYKTRVKALAEAGYRDLEFWTWGNKDINVLKSFKEEYSLNFTAFCTKSGNLVDPGKHEEFKQGLIESIAVAKELDCKRLITLSGDELEGVDRCTQHESIVSGLKNVVPLLEENDITLVLEPLNTRVDHKGYYLWDADEAFEIIDKVGSDNVKILFDIYHQQIMQGDLLRRIEANINKIGHFHAAGNPGRGHPSSGEINYSQMAKAIDSFGYSGYIGMEYFNHEPILEGLAQCREIF